MFIAERSNGFFIAFYASESYIPPSANLTLHENYVDYTELGEVEYGNVRLSVAAILDKDSDSIDKIINRNLLNYSKLQSHLSEWLDNDIDCVRLTNVSVYEIYFLDEIGIHSDSNQINAEHSESVFIGRYKSKSIILVLDWTANTFQLMNCYQCGLEKGLYCGTMKMLGMELILVPDHHIVISQILQRPYDVDLTTTDIENWSDGNRFTFLGDDAIRFDNGDFASPVVLFRISE